MKNNRFFSRSTHANTDRQNSNGSISPNMLGMTVSAMTHKRQLVTVKNVFKCLITRNGIAGRG